MKKLIFNLLLFTFLLTVLFTVAVNANSAALVDNKITYLDDDPNEPQPESTLTNCSDKDPNEPQPEAVFSCSDKDPNEPKPEST